MFYGKIKYKTFFCKSPPTLDLTTNSAGGCRVAWLGAREREPQAACHIEGEWHHLHRPTFRRAIGSKLCIPPHFGSVPIFGELAVPTFGIWGIVVTIFNV